MTDRLAGGDTLAPTRGRGVSGYEVPDVTVSFFFRNHKKGIPQLALKEV